MAGTWGLALAERARSHLRVPRMAFPDWRSRIGVPRIGMRLQGDGIALGMDQGGVTFGRWYYEVLEALIGMYHDEKAGCFCGACILLSLFFTWPAE